MRSRVPRPPLYQSRSGGESYFSAIFSARWRAVPLATARRTRLPDPHRRDAVRHGELGFGRGEHRLHRDARSGLEQRGPARRERDHRHLYGGKYRRDPGLLRTHGEQIQPPGGLGYAYQLLAAWGWTSALWLRTLPEPALVMHGNDDPIVPLVNAKLLAALLRDAHLHVVYDGHLFMLTRATEVAPVVRGFLDAEPA